MIGLNTSIFKSAGRKLVNLLGALKDRATYYENGADSVAEKNHIDDLGVLDKATILLTPTATSDARVHSVKTYTGDELVANGNFEELGDEKVVNGTFSANSNWTNVGSNGWTIDTNEQTANYTDISTYIFQGISTAQNKAYKVVLDIEHTSGILLVKSFNSQTIITVNTPGRQTLTGYFTEEDANANFGFIPSGSNVSGKIHSVSVQQVDPNNRWSVGDKWSITNGAARLVSNDSNASGFIQSSVFTIGNTYNITFDATVVSGSAKLEKNGGGVLIRIDETKTYNHTFVADKEDMYFNRLSSVSDITIDNVSVVDVSSDFDFDRASSATRINSSGLVQDMQSITDPELVLNGDFEELGDEEVTDGDFPNLDNWSVNGGDYATIVDGALNSNNTENGSWFAENISQNISFVNGKTYKITFKAKNISGNLNLRITHQSHVVFSNNLTSSFVDYTVYYTAQANNDSIRIFCNDAIGEFQIDNISVQKVDPNSDWNLSIGDTIIEEGVAKFPTSTNSFLIQSNVADLSVKNYKLTYEVVSTNGNNFRIAGGNSAFGTITLDSATIGTKTAYLTSNGTHGALQFNNNSFIGSIDNVSVKDITFSDGVDLARINYDSNGDNGHILLEPTSTNLVTYSEDFSNAAWEKQSNITPTYNTTETLSPDGTYNATKFIGNGSDGVFVQAPVTGVITRSVYLKSVRSTVNVVLKDPVLTQTAKTLTLNETWQRYDLSESNQHGSLSGLWIDDIPSSGIYMWGAQIEALPYATSYIPTLTGSTVTRANEKLYGSGNSTLINSREGVLYAEIAGLVDDDSTSNSYHRIISISDNSITNRVELKALNDGTLEFRFDSSSSDIRLYHTSFDFTIFNKIALVWESGRCAAYLNGVKVVEDLTFSTFSSNALHELSFDSPYDGGSNFFYGKCKALAVFNEALSDDELELLTGVTNYGSFSELASANGYTII